MASWGLQEQETPIKDHILYVLFTIIQTSCKIIVYLLLFLIDEKISSIGKEDTK